MQTPAVRAMIEVIKKYASRSNIRTFPSLDHLDFLNLLKISSVLVGNSSSGIIEAPSVRDSGGQYREQATGTTER